MKWVLVVAIVYTSGITPPHEQRLQGWSTRLSCGIAADSVLQQALLRADIRSITARCVAE